MAALISPLMSGMAGCESGTVTIYQRGTATPATVYTNYDLSGGTTGTSGVHSLDANGRIELYSAEPLEITAKNSGGATVATFVWEDAAGAVTVQQTGYNSGNVTTVKSVLASLYSSLGAADGQVMFNGVATNIQDAFAAAQFAQFSVKGYGAVGNGVANDTTAIQNAINAAEAAGGGIVFIGPGTYNISAALVIDSAGVYVLGVGNPIIQTTSTTANGFTVSAQAVIEGIIVRVANAAGANNSGYGISLDASASLSRVINCTVQGNVTNYVFTRGINLMNASYVAISGCDIKGQQYGVYMSAASFALYNRIENCDILADSECVRIENQRYLRLSGLYTTRLSPSGAPTDLVGVNCDWVTLTNSSLVWNGISTDSNCSHWYESGCFIDDYTTIVTTGGDMYFRDAPPEGPNIASAAALTLTRAPMHRVYTVTGTTGITSIVTTGIPEGYVVTLIFAGALTMTDGSNLKLAGNFTTTADDSITLIYKDSSWVELSRSVN